MQIILPLKNLFLLVAKDYGRFNIPDKSAALAYRALFALVPILILIISIAEMSIFGSLTIAGMEEFFLRFFGPQSAIFFDNVVEVTSSSMSIFVAVVGSALMVYGAIGFFLTMQRSFFEIFSVSKLDRSPVKNVLYTYFYSLGYLVLFLLFIISLFVARFFLTSGVEMLEELIAYSLSLGTLRALTAILMLVFLTTFVSISYRFFSRNSLKWIDAIIGGLVAAILIIVLNNVLGLYFTFSSVLSLYGTAAFLVTILLWAYFFSMILFCGAIIARSVAKV